MTTKTERGHLSPHCLSLFVHALPLHMRNIHWSLESSARTHAAAAGREALRPPMPVFEYQHVPVRASVSSLSDERETA